MVMGDKRLSEIMTNQLRTVSPNATIKEAAQIMADEDIGWLPVVDGNGLLQGTITDRDIAIRAVAKGKDHNVLVHQIMSEGVVAAREDQSLEDAARLMRVNQIRRVAIVDGENKPLGVISLGDVAQRTDEANMVYETLEQVAAPS